MKKVSDEPKLNEIHLTDAEFLASFNANMPSNYPKATPALLERFREENPSLFRSGKHWTLDQHRKALINWLPQNL